MKHCPFLPTWSETQEKVKSSKEKILKSWHHELILGTTSSYQYFALNADCTLLDIYLCMLIIFVFR